MKNKILVVFLLTLIFNCFSQIIISNEETKWLGNNESVDVFVSEANPPYEFRNENGQLVGINIDLTRKIMNEFNLNPIFVSYKNRESEIISGFNEKLEKNKNYIKTRSLYHIKFYGFAYNNDVNISNAKSLYMISMGKLKDYAQKVNKDIQINQFSNINNLINSFLGDENGLLVIDNFYIDKVADKLKQYELHHKTIKFDLPFEYLVRRDQKELFSLISKSMYEVELKNDVVGIFNKWQKKLSLIDTNTSQIDEKMYFILGANALFFLIILFLMIKMKIFKKEIIQKNIQKNELISKLESEIDKLTHSLVISESKNRNVLENINSIAISLDLEGKILYVNKLIEDILGYDSNLLIGSDISEVVTEEQKEKLLSIFNDKEKEKFKSDEIVISTRDGLKKNFIFTALLNKLEDDSHTINCILQDITERKSLEIRLESYANHLEELVKQRTQRLKDSEERFRMLVEKSFDGIYLLFEGKFIFVNPAFTDLTGYNLDELQENRKKLIDFIIESDKDNFKKFYQNYKNEPSKFHSTEFKLKHRNGKQIHVKFQIAQVIYNGREVEMGIIRDITEKKKTELAKLERERLQVVSQLAVTANDRINSPLCAINGYAELIDMNLNEDNVIEKNAIKSIYKSTKIIETIMKKMKSLASIKIKKYNLNDIKMLDLDSEYSEAIEEMEAAIHEKKED